MKTKAIVKTNNLYDLNAVLSQMKLAAKSAGKLLLSYQKKVKHLQVSHKDAQGVVSEADLASEKLIMTILSKKFPRISFLAEESCYLEKADPFDSAKRNLDWCWIIDPLDGTTNFLSGLDYYAICISLAYKGKPVAGLVFRPETDECFWALKNSGAFKQSLFKTRKKVKIDSWRNKKKLKSSLLVTGFATEKGELFEQEFFLFKNIMANCRGVRRMGSAALDLCYVAEGIFDGFWERGLAPWDTAAASLICIESSVRVTDYKAQEFSPYNQTILAARAPLYKSFQELFD